MCKIKSIEINGFRGIGSLRLDNLQMVNVLLGNNNCGKSSALEAIMMLMGASKPSLALEMNMNRDYNKISKEDIRLFFHNLSSGSFITVKSVSGDGKIRDLKISYFESETEKMPISDDGKIQTGEDTFGLKYEYQDGDKAYVSILTVNPNKKEILTDSTEKEKPRTNTVFVAPRYNFNNFIRHFNQIVTDKEKENVIRVLHNVEPRITDVAVVGDKVMIDIGLDKLMPINVLGDGTRKMFTLITAMYSVRGGILIVDEVDNGLYYKTMITLWRALFKSARIMGVQLFISTHSLDSLRALDSVLSETDFLEMQSDVELFTLRRGEDDVVVGYRYDYEKFSYVLGQEVEIR